MENENEVIAVCSECKTEANSQRVEKDPFYNSNQPIACKLCGGVVILMERVDRESALEQADRQRGL